MTVHGSLNAAPGTAPNREQQVDLRLAIATVAAWAATLWGLSRSPGSVAIVAVSAMGLGVALMALGSRRRWCYPVAFGVFAVALAAAPLSWRLAQVKTGELARLADSRAAVTAELTVSGDPRLLTARGPSGSPRVAVDAHFRAITVAGHRSEVRGSVLVLAAADVWRGVLPGQRVKLDGRLMPPLSNDLLTATLSASTNPELLGRPPWWQGAAGAVRLGLRRASAGLPDQSAGLLPGLVDGDTSQLDPVLAARFRVAGLTHLVAVSGTNCSILIGAVALLLRRARASPRVTALVGCLVLVAFVIAARPSPSVLRAATMAAIALAALASGRERSSVPTLAAAVLGLLLYKPELAVDLGFLLSVSATASLMLLAPRWVQTLRQRRLPAGLAEAVAVAAAAHLVTAPLIVAISGRLSLVAIPANVLAEPVVAAVTVLGVLTAVLSVIWLPVAVLSAQLAGIGCRWLVWVAEYFGTVPGAAIPWPSGLTGGMMLAILTVLGLVASRRRQIAAALGVALVVALVIQIPVRSTLASWPPPGWLMVACDVGQGDGLAIAAGPGQAVVIDSGPDPVAMDRCLRDLGVSRVPLLILTHFHLDHVGGLAGVLHNRTVEQALVSPLADPRSGVQLVTGLFDRYRVPMKVAMPGTSVTINQLAIDVLGPRRVYRNTRSDPNNSSVVLRIATGGFRLLLTGDAEVEAQDDLLGAGLDLRADVLKVPHHGSAYSDPAFLAAVHASVGLISVGVNNDYGHPSALLLAEMARLGVPTYRTDQLGDVAAVADDHHVVVVTHATKTGNAAGDPKTPGRSKAQAAAAVAVAVGQVAPRQACSLEARLCGIGIGTGSCSGARSGPAAGPVLVVGLLPGVRATMVRWATARSPPDAHHGGSINDAARAVCAVCAGDNPGARR